jgi:hypothetical protein
MFVRNGKKRLLYAMPKTIGDCLLSTAIFPVLREAYPSSEWDFYVASESQYQDVFNANPHIDKWIPFVQEMVNPIMMEGRGNEKGYVDVCFSPAYSTQQLSDYQHNSSDKIIM